ncbi:MAG TPA: hypothetical protein VFH33_01125, partial [Candidatus Krumholzibacteria bacterium]|nr:hypothetical protein [Candidatus Krumholzibacteria bacterium]
AGNYTVVVDSVTADNSDFNEVLYDGWNPTSPTYLPVTVGPSSSGNSFAFEPDVAHVIAQIDDDVYPTNGKTYQWWRIQLLHALLLPWHHSSYFYTPEQLTGFIHDIEGFALPNQYDFTPGHELLEAFRILNNHACSDDNDDDDMTMFGEEGRVLMNDPNIGADGTEDEGHHGHHDVVCDAFKELQRELLTTEFNHVTGRGLYTNLPLQYNLIQWGEGVLVGNPPGGDDMKIGGPQRAIQSPLEAGGEIFRKVNGATGGGGTGG